MRLAAILGTVCLAHAALTALLMRRGEADSMNGAAWVRTAAFILTVKQPGSAHSIDIALYIPIIAVKIRINIRFLLVKNRYKGKKSCQSEIGGGLLDYRADERIYAFMKSENLFKEIFERHRS